MYIKYRINARILPEQFITLLIEAGLAHQRPMYHPESVREMLEHSNLTASAWVGGKLVGIARALTDFQVCCYLPDLAVSKTYQRKKIGTRLQALIQQQLGDQCQMILMSPPNVNTYYFNLGFEPNPRCWTLPRNRRLNRLTKKATV